MILLVLLGYTAWGYGWLRLWMHRTLLRHEYALMYPVGLALSGLLFFAGWISNIPFSLLTLLWWIGVISCAVWWVRSTDFEKLQSSLQKFFTKFSRTHLLDTQLPFAQLPWLYFGAVITISLGVALLWQLFLRPIAWDAVALYDFRALRIVDGWTPQHFMTQFSRMPEYQAYDFLHPITSSIWWSVAYQSGAQRVIVLYSALLAHVIWFGWYLWKSTSARVVWLFLWLSMPALFISLIQGYGAYPATLFLTLALMWWSYCFKERGALRLTEWGILGSLLLGSVSARVTEYYWVGIALITVLALIIQHKSQIVDAVKNILSVWFLPGVSLILWYMLRSDAVRVSGSIDADRSLSALVSGISEGSALQFIDAFVAEVQVWLISPVVPWVLLIIVGVWFSLKKSRKTSIQWQVWAVLIVMLLGIQLAGMIVLNIVFGERWIEARQAMDRAIMPILAVCFVWLADLTEEMSQ